MNIRHPGRCHSILLQLNGFVDRYFETAGATREGKQGSMFLILNY